MTEIEVRICHQILLKLLIDFRDFCNKYQFQYFIIGGTLLGAVRHGGFIPWDIDADIAMPREDYEEMLTIINNEFPSMYYIQNTYTDSKFHTPKTKILVRGVKKDNPNKLMVSCETGLNLDIFPLDVAPKDLVKRESQRRKIRLFKTLLRFKIRYKINAYSSKEKITKFMRWVINGSLAWIPERYVISCMTKEMIRYNEIESDYWCSMASHYDYHKQVMSKEVYGKGTEIQFEGHCFVGPDMTHEYLQQIYGDYWELPPLADRQAQYSHLELTFDENAKEIWAEFIRMERPI